MAEDLRHRYADAVSGVINEWATRPGDSGQFIGRLVAAVMAARDEELERLRRQAGWHGQCVPLTKWAEELRDKLNAAGQREQAVNDGRTALVECNGWRERAETAEAGNARARALHPSAEEAHATQNALCVECCTPAPCATRKALDSQKTDRG